MLQRVLEPEVMDTDQEARDYNNMDHSEVNRQFVDDLIAAGFQGGDLLDLGTGTALIPIELAGRELPCRIMAADAAVAMLDLARMNLEIAGFADVVQLSHCDAKKMPYADGMFDWVVSNSIIHHIPEPREVLAEAWRVTKPGGWLFFRDLARPDSRETLDQLVATYAAECNESQRKMFGESLHAALTVEEVDTMLQELGARPERLEKSSDRHWTFLVQRS